MYRRFLNNDDYLGIITPEALAQLTRGNDARFIQAEESAEMSIVEYLSENYEIEQFCNLGGVVDMLYVQCQREREYHDNDLEVLHYKFFELFHILFH